MRRELANAFRYRYQDREVGGIRMVGLLFAPPEARLARDEIVPSLDYFHHRSGTTSTSSEPATTVMGTASARRTGGHEGRPTLVAKTGLAIADALRGAAGAA